MTHEKVLISQQRGRERESEREPRGGEEFEDVERRAQICPEQHVSAVSFSNPDGGRLRSPPFLR